LDLDEDMEKRLFREEEEAEVGRIGVGSVQGGGNRNVIDRD